MKLRQSGTTLSKGAVSGIINRHLNRIEEVNGGQPQSRKRKVNSVRTPEVIKKIKKFTQVTDPISQELMGNKTGVSRQTVRRVIDEDLMMLTMRPNPAFFMPGSTACASRWLHSK